MLAPLSIQIAFLEVVTKHYGRLIKGISRYAFRNVSIPKVYSYPSTAKPCGCLFIRSTATLNLMDRLYSMACQSIDL